MPGTLFSAPYELDLSKLAFTELRQRLLLDELRATTSPLVIPCYIHVTVPTLFAQARKDALIEF
jgi:hypothetical protein